MITSPHNEKLKLIRKLQARKHRERSGLFAAEGEDLVEAAERAGAAVEFVLVAGQDVEPELLDAVSELGSGTRVIGVYRQSWSPPGGDLSVYLEGVRDPGNVGTIFRTVHALADGPLVLGPGLRRSLLAARGPGQHGVGVRPAACEGCTRRARGIQARARRERGRGPCERWTFERRSSCAWAGSGRGCLPTSSPGPTPTARIPMRSDAPDSLNVASAAAVGLYEVANRMADRA